jgi:hypothetical protein
MKLTVAEQRYLTALLREQNQSGCRGPAHDLLRRHAYPDAPLAGAGSLAFSYESVPLTSMLLRDFTDLATIDDFVRNAKPSSDVTWPWASAAEYRARLDEARQEWTSSTHARATPPVQGAQPTRQHLPD